MSESSETADTPASSRQSFWMIAVCFLLSGFAALLYETVWLRQFAIVLGTSEQALAVILASYMGGLAFGAWVAGKWVDKIRRPVWTYGILELGIALCAIAMPWGLWLVEMLQVALFGGSDQPPAAGELTQTLFGLSACFGLILLPTAMMGATLPLLAKHVIHRDRDIGPRIGLLYGINTFGAVAGTLVAAFLFLPRFGLGRTTLVGAAINGLVFLIVFVFFRVMRSGGADAGADERLAAESGSPELGSVSVPDRLEHRYRLVLWFAGFAGAVAFCYEIIFTRMLSHLLGGSIYAFATMLAGFLLGIALGGTIASRFAIRRERSAIAFAYAQSLAGLCALLAYRSIDMVAGWSFEDWGGASAVFSQVVVSILVLLPTATCIGATFPLATRVFARDQTEAATASARVYFWNTVGGILGALATGMFILPVLAYQGSTYFAVAINAFIAILIVVLMRLNFVHVAAGCLTFAVLLLFSPGEPDNVMRVSALDGRPIQGERIFSRVGRAGTVVLFGNLGDTQFFTNGLPEAIVAQRGTQNPYASSGAWLAALPPLLHPSCESMLIIGLGGGVAAAHVPPSVAEIDVFELEPAVVDANEFVAGRRNRDPLADPRVNIILNDGRNGLALTAKKYDVIVSQPSHPWTAGASHLYTREFATTVRERLKEGGIFLQWMNVDFINEELLRALPATLLDVFPHLRVYEPFPGNLLFTASDQPIRPESTTKPILDMSAEDASFYREFGIESPTHLFMHLRVDEPELRDLAEGVRPITDEFNLLAMRAPGLLNSGASDEVKVLLDRYSPLNQSPEQLLNSCPTLQPTVLGVRLLQREREIDLTNAFLAYSVENERTLYDALVAKADGRQSEAVALLKGLADTAPDDPRAPFMLLAYHRLGTFPGDSLSQSEVDELSQKLDERHRALFAAIEAIVVNDLQTVQQQEEQMATFGIDEVGYELAVRMRVLWRITTAGPQSKALNSEALQLIADANPVLGSDALIPFRVAAAIGAGQGDVAAACVGNYTRSVVDRILQKKVTTVGQLENLRSNLVKCRSMFGDNRALIDISDQRYDETLAYLDKVIAGEI